MPDKYISRAKALRAVQKQRGANRSPAQNAMLDRICCDIKNMPAADVAPVVHGYWEGYSHSKFYGMDEFHEPIYRDGVLYYCSECRRRSIIKMRFCANCDARMDGGDTDGGKLSTGSSKTQE